VRHDWDANEVGRTHGGGDIGRWARHTGRRHYAWGEIHWDPNEVSRMHREETLEVGKMPQVRGERAGK